MRINPIKLLLFALAVVSWLISDVHLLAVIFANGPLMPWLIINIISRAYWWAVAVATDMENERRKHTNIKKEHPSTDQSEECSKQL